MRLRLLFVLVLGLYATLAVGYSLVVPLGEASDEVSHWSYVRYLVEQHRLPLPDGAVLGESHQPPLYYMIGAAATFWIPVSSAQPQANPDFVLGDPQSPNALLHPRTEGFPYAGNSLAWHMVRLLSILMGAVTVWATWRLALEIVPEDEWLALGAASFVAFLPEFLFISSVVNNDNLVTMLSSLAVLLSVRAVKKSLSWQSALGLGLLMGLAGFAKLSGLVVWIFVACVLGFVAFKASANRQILLHTALAYSTAALVMLPWILHNVAQSGDPLGWSLVMAATPVRTESMTASDWEIFLRGLYTSFWGRFGAVVQLRMANVVYLLLGAWTIVTGIGWVALLRNACAKKLDGHVLKSAVLFGLFWLILLGAHLRWTLTMRGTDQARQLFPGLPLLALVFYSGWLRLFSTRRRAGVALGGGASLALAISVLLFLQSTYAPPLRDVSQLAPVNSSHTADFGNLIRIRDYAVRSTEIAPGDSIAVSISWQAVSAPGQSYWLLLQLATKDKVLADRDGVPSAGRLTTDWWQPGQILESSHTLQTPSDLPPGTYTLRIGLHPFEQWDWLPVHGQDMYDLAKIVVKPPAP